MFVERFKLSFVISDFIPVWRLPMGWSLNQTETTIFCLTLILGDFQYFFSLILFPSSSIVGNAKLTTDIWFHMVWCLVAGNIGHVFHFLVSSIRFIYLYFCLIFFFFLSWVNIWLLAEIHLHFFFSWAFVNSPTLNTTRELTLGKFDNYILYVTHVMINSLPSRLFLWSQKLRTSKINNQIIINKEVAEKKWYKPRCLQ